MPSAPGGGDEMAANQIHHAPPSLGRQTSRDTQVGGTNSLILGYKLNDVRTAEPSDDVIINVRKEAGYDVINGVRTKTSGDVSNDVRIESESVNNSNIEPVGALENHDLKDQLVQNDKDDLEYTGHINYAVTMVPQDREFTSGNSRLRGETKFYENGLEVVPQRWYVNSGNDDTSDSEEPSPRRISLSSRAESSDQFNHSNSSRRLRTSEEFSKVAAEDHPIADTNQSNGNRRLRTSEEFSKVATDDHPISDAGLRRTHESVVLNRDDSYPEARDVIAITVTDNSVIDDGDVSDGGTDNGEISIDEAEDEAGESGAGNSSGPGVGEGGQGRTTTSCLGGVAICCRRFGSEVKHTGGKIAAHVTSERTKKQLRRKCCSLEALRNILPCLKWIPNYRLEQFKGDLVAGLTTGFAVLPQGLAYGQIVEIPAVYGLYSAFMGSFAYAIFGTSKDVAVGPSAVVSIITAQYGTGRSPILKDPTYAIILALFSGIILLSLGLLRLGFLFSFISLPVLKAFRAAAGITIFMSRIKKWWGLLGVPREFLPQLYWTLNKLPETNFYDFLLGGLCILMLFTFKKLKAQKWKRRYRDLPIGWKLVKRLFWFLGTERNILVITFSAGVVYAMIQSRLNITYTGYIVPGVPSFRAPNFTLALPNSTDVLSFSDIASDIGAGFMFVPLVSILETISIGKALGRRANYVIDYNQELIAVGVGNILCSCVSGHPVTGAFLRSGINVNAGVKTPGAGILAGAIVLLALAFITPLLSYIPTCAMAATIMMGAIDVISFHKVGFIWRIKKIDLIPWLFTFISSLTLGIEYGVFFGVAASLVIHLTPSLRPKMNMTVQADGTKHIVIETSNGGVFPSADYLSKELRKQLRDDCTRTVVLDLQHVFNVDSSIIYCLQRLQDTYQKAGAQLVFAHIQPAVQRTLNKTNLKNYCLS